MKFSWKDIKKGVFIDGHERKDMIKNQHIFFKIMKELLFYIVNFKSDGFMEEKIYSFDCVVGGLDWQPIIVIIHDKSIFSTNNKKWQVWVWNSNAFLYSKDKGKDIMVSNFLLPFSQLNLLSLF